MSLRDPDSDPTVVQQRALAYYKIPGFLGADKPCEPEPVFRPWPKIPRWNREWLITEKIDGTNACVIVTEDGEVHAQSRKRIITPENDNYGFARFVKNNAEEFADLLGPGYHFGEWCGLGIQRGYGLNHKYFALFNIERWRGADLPAYCTTVPLLARAADGADLAVEIEYALDYLRSMGSRFMGTGFGSPEGIVIYHPAGNVSFKILLENDAGHKSS